VRKSAPSALPVLRGVFQCFQPYGEDEQDYARATAYLDKSCADEAVALLRELHHNKPVDRPDDREAHFVAEQNALVIKNAEEYYRTMIQGGPESWNVRDRHMTETLARLRRFHGPQAKAIVWEHNTHIGDARYTDMAADGMVNVGQLARERYGESNVVLVGFGSHRGSVIAGREWGAMPESMRVPPGREDSWEDLLHEVEPA